MNTDEGPGGGRLLAVASHPHYAPRRVDGDLRTRGCDRAGRRAAGRSPSYRLRPPAPQTALAASRRLRHAAAPARRLFSFRLPGHDAGVDPAAPRLRRREPAKHGRALPARAGLRRPPCALLGDAHLPSRPGGHGPPAGGGAHGGRDLRRRRPVQPGGQARRVRRPAFLAGRAGLFQPALVPDHPGGSAGLRDQRRVPGFPRQAPLHRRRPAGRRPSRLDSARQRRSRVLCRLRRQLLPARRRRGLHRQHPGRGSDRGESGDGQHRAGRGGFANGGDGGFRDPGRRSGGSPRRRLAGGEPVGAGRAGPAGPGVRLREADQAGRDRLRGGHPSGHRLLRRAEHPQARRPARDRPLRPGEPAPPAFQRRELASVGEMAAAWRTRSTTRWPSSTRKRR